MTIDKLIEKIKNEPNYLKNQDDIIFGIKYSEEMENIRLTYKGISDAYIITNNIMVKAIKELYKINQELEVYKEALELMAKDYYFDYLIEMTDYNVSQTIEKYLQKAREQNEHN